MFSFFCFSCPLSTRHADSQCLRACPSEACIHAGELVVARLGKQDSAGLVKRGGGGCIISSALRKSVLERPVLGQLITWFESQMSRFVPRLQLELKRGRAAAQCERSPSPRRGAAPSKGKEEEEEDRGGAILFVIAG